MYVRSNSPARLQVEHLLADADILPSPVLCHVPYSDVQLVKSVLLLLRQRYPRQTQTATMLIDIQRWQSGGLLLSARSGAAFWRRAASELMPIVSSFVILAALQLLADTASSALAIASCLGIVLRRFQQKSLQAPLLFAAKTSSQHLDLIKHLPSRYRIHRSATHNTPPLSNSHPRSPIYEGICILFFSQAGDIRMLL